jgi:hypothetical protein
LILCIQSRLESEVQLFRILATMVFVAGVARHTYRGACIALKAEASPLPPKP